LFRPNQIICIDQIPENLLLLAELIQMVPERQRCWAKPLALACQENYQLKLLHDLRAAPQLILPDHLFREAVDTEVLPLMTELFQWDKPEHLEMSAENAEILSRQALHAFISALSGAGRIV
jgi:hypothetical protein